MTRLLQTEVTPMQTSRKDLVQLVSTNKYSVSLPLSSALNRTRNQLIVLQVHDASPVAMLGGALRGRVRRVDVCV